LDIAEIADMVADNTMPQPIKILASIIGVTIVGPKNIPERSLPGFCRVGRQQMKAALMWLKANNPLYADITISDEQLEPIMEDGFPVEIVDATQYSDDIIGLEHERVGYVPEDIDFDINGEPPTVAARAGVQAAGQFGQTILNINSPKQ